MIADVIPFRSRITPERLSAELRAGENADLKRRRWIIGLSFLGAAIGQVVALYQVGIVRRLPSLPGRLFDANKVDASNYAYKRMRTPDGLIMVATYALTAWLAGAGGKDRATESPLLPIAMGAKTAYDAATCVKLAQEEWRDNKAFCEYCQVATVASFISLALALPEVIRAVRRLRG